jgi:hypothetical protein
LAMRQNLVRKGACRPLAKRRTLRMRAYAECSLDNLDATQQDRDAG